MNDIPPWGIGPPYDRRRYSSLVAELRDRKQWLEDLGTKGFSLRGGSIAEESARIEEIEKIMAGSLYTIEAEHRHKPGRKFYLDQDLCLSTDPKSAKALSLEAANIALTYLLALACLLADGAPNMTAKIVEKPDDV